MLSSSILHGLGIMYRLVNLFENTVEAQGETLEELYFNSTSKSFSVRLEKPIVRVLIDGQEHQVEHNEDWESDVLILLTTNGFFLLSD